MSEKRFEVVIPDNGCSAKVHSGGEVRTLNLGDTWRVSDVLFGQEELEASRKEFEGGSLYQAEREFIEARDKVRHLEMEWKLGLSDEQRRSQHRLEKQETRWYSPHADVSLDLDWKRGKREKMLAKFADRVINHEATKDLTLDQIRKMSPAEARELGGGGNESDAQSLFARLCNDATELAEHVWMTCETGEPDHSLPDEMYDAVERAQDAAREAAWDAAFVALRDGIYLDKSAAGLAGRHIIWNTGNEWQEMSAEAWEKVETEATA